MWLVALGGMSVLIGLALLVGALEGRAQREAWRRIAAERRAIGHTRRELLEWEAGLIRAAESGNCPRCRLQRIDGVDPA